MQSPPEENEEIRRRYGYPIQQDEGTSAVQSQPGAYGFSLATLLGALASLIDFAAALLPWLIASEPHVVEGRVIEYVKVVSLSALDFLPSKQYLALVLVAVASGAIIVLLSTPKIVFNVGETRAARLRELLCGVGILCSLAPAFLFTVGYEPGIAYFFEGKLVSARSQLGIGSVLPFFAAMTFLASFLLEALRD